MSWVLALILVFSFTAFGQNSNNVLLVDEPGKAVLRIFVNCEYKLVLKSPKDKEIKININQIGNGFFTGSHSGSFDFVASAAHFYATLQWVSWSLEAYLPILIETPKKI